MTMALRTPVAPIPSVPPVPFNRGQARRSGPDAEARWTALTLRFGLIGTGASLLSVAMAAWTQGQVTEHHEVVAMVFGAYAVAFLLIALGVAPGIRTGWRSSLIPIAVVAGLLLYSYVRIEISLPTYQTDNAVFSHVAAERLLDGINPYSVHDASFLADSAQRFGLQPTFVTHTTDGTTLDNLMSWPAGSILPLAPFLASGGSDVRWVVVMFEIVAVAIIWLAAPRELRPLSLIPVLVDPDLFLQFTGGGVMDFIWVVPMLGAAFALYRRHFLWSAFCFGVAAGTKQQPWLLAPFLMLYLWNTSDGSSIRNRIQLCCSYAGTAALGFLLLNGPFIALSPIAWAKGALLPFMQQLVAFGSGLSMLTQTGIVDLPKGFYSLATFGVWGLLLLAYALYFRTLKHAIWLMPAIVMWFGYRSLQNYFIYWTPVIMIALFAWWDEMRHAQMSGD